MPLDGAQSECSARTELVIVEHVVLLRQSTRPAWHPLELILRPTYRAIRSAPKLLAELANLHPAVRDCLPHLKFSHQYRCFDFFTLDGIVLDFTQAAETVNAELRALENTSADVGRQNENRSARAARRSVATSDVGARGSVDDSVATYIAGKKSWIAELYLVSLKICFSTTVIPDFFALERNQRSSPMHTTALTRSRGSQSQLSNSDLNEFTESESRRSS